MQSTYPRTELAKALSACCRIVPARHPKMILQSVRITSQGEITATDLDSVGIRLNVPCQSQDHGDVIINAAYLKKIVDLSMGDEIEIRTSANACEVVTSESRYDVPFEDAGAFPTIPKSEGNPAFTLPAEELQSAVNLTDFAAAIESARYAMTGVNFDLSSKPTMVATDGKAMSVVPLSCSAKELSDPHVIPVRALQVLCSLASGTVSVWLDKSSASFQCDGVYVYARLVEGRYPTWREVLLKKIDSKLPLNVGAFARHIKQAMIATDEDSRGVRFSFAKNVCSMQGKSEGRGVSAVQMPVASDVKFETILDPRLILNVLNRLPPDEDVSFEHVSNNTVIQMAYKDSVFIVVPMERGAK